MKMGCEMAKLFMGRRLVRRDCPNGDMAMILERALDAFIAAQLKKTYAVGAKNDFWTVPKEHNI